MVYCLIYFSSLRLKQRKLFNLQKIVFIYSFLTFTLDTFYTIREFSSITSLFGEISISQILVSLAQNCKPSSTSIVWLWNVNTHPNITLKQHISWRHISWCHLSSFHQRSSSIKGRLPSKVVFHQRWSSIKGRLPS